MRHAFIAAALVLASVWGKSAVADPSVKDLAARTEIRPIETLTLTDQQFLTGDKNGKATTIAGAAAISSGGVRPIAGCHPAARLGRPERWQ